ncbi:hypothetical protein [Streptomyces capparidis]
MPAVAVGARPAVRAADRVRGGRRYGYWRARRAPGDLCPQVGDFRP